MSKRRPKAVKLVTTCPNCGEAVEIIITKKQLKALWKDIKLPIGQASVQAEKIIYMDMRTE